MRLYSKAIVEPDGSNFTIVFLYPMDSKFGVLCTQGPCKEYFFRPLDLSNQTHDMLKLISRNRILHDIPDHEFQGLVQRVKEYEFIDWLKYQERVKEDLPTLIEIIDNYRSSASEGDFH